MLREEYTECANQYVSTVQSNTNLERIVAIDKHLALYRQNNIKDFVSIQLQDEKEKLLTEQKTRERYELITDLGEKLSAYSRSIQIRGELTGAVTAAFGYVGISTLLNTINKKKNRSGQRNNDER
jgi:putative ribosome biogenesis GTPase RsgA